MERLWSRVLVGHWSQCWPWTGCLNFLPDGYGDLGSEGRVLGERMAHRLAWIFTHGAIPEDLTIDHLCYNRRCCNPLHLELVTRAENTWRANMRRAGLECGNYIPREPHPCAQCKIVLTLNKYCSQACAHMAQRRVERPSRQELLALLENNTYVAIGKKFGVSDSTIRKWLKSGAASEN